MKSRITAWITALLLVSAAWPLGAGGQEAPEETEPEVAAPDSPDGSPQGQPAGDESAGAFEIKSILVEGNTLLPEERVQQVLEGFLGVGRSAADVDRARAALEQIYHDSGFPTVLVNIPEQTVEEGRVRLEVIESTIGAVRVVGNRYHPTERILRDLPSLAPGSILYVGRVEEEIARVNRKQELKVTPALTPGRTLGTTDVELKVEDKASLHGSLEVNNRTSPGDESHFRVNAMLSYGNLWQLDHSFTLQYQTAPEKVSEVQVLYASYVLPAPWARDDLLALYGVWSDSGKGFGEGFETKGKGTTLGFRYIRPLPAAGSYGHNLTAGFDYKDQDEKVTAPGGATTKSPVRYFPFSLAYAATVSDGAGSTALSTGLSASFRGLVAEDRKFGEKRSGARGDYLIATAGAERLQPVGPLLGLRVKLDGQMTSEPLVSSEQFSAGGMESVRGYQESEVSGDEAFHVTLEIGGRGLVDEDAQSSRVTPYLFYDGAALRQKDPLPGEKQHKSLQGVGLGVRGRLTRFLEFGADWGWALVTTDHTKAGESRVSARVKGEF